MPSSTRRPAASPERRAAIEAGAISATERLLAEGVTFTELGMQRIAFEAGVARSTLYLHFRDKNAILIRLAGVLRSGAFDIVSGWSPEDPSGLDGLTETLLRVIRFYRRRAHIFAAITEVSGYDRDVREYWDAELDRFIERSQAWMLGEQRAGRAPADLDPSIASQVIVYGGMRAIARHVTSGDPHRDLAVARELAVNQWFGALRRPPVD
ncbi:TetR/AcrR family transcriptional regulator [Streptosporangium subroseum]|uniref:TetR/AcrR family transcriptional regulator n=1 Tax=Streptosporangium subroseum TaxID=106412 RepID=UPI00352EDDF9